jgi:Transcriptional regulator, AbiEi antitoxin/Protein of unknown function (DUF559)
MGTKVDNRPEMLASALAREQWGVLSTEELLACGFSRRAIVVRVQKGLLHRLHQGVYAFGHAGVPREGRFLAAVKSCGPGAVLSHFSAAALWGYVDWDGRRFEVTICDTTPRMHPGIRVHRTRYLEPRDVRHHKGIPVTSPARTALDLCSQLPFRGARRAVRQGLSLQRLSVGDLVAILGRQERRPGASTLRRILATGAVPTRTVLEDVVLELIVAAGLQRPDVNVPIYLDGRRVVPDFRWPSARLIVEADSATWHDNKLAREDDAERQALLEVHGERVIRVTWNQAIGRRPQSIARLREAGRDVLI